MNILVLEDEFTHQKRMRSILEELKDEQMGEIIISSKPQELLNKLDEGLTGNIYFLDLEIKGVEHTGFETAKEIRKRDSFGVIVFVTTHSEMAPITFQYQVSALDFIPKDLERQIFKGRIASSIQLAKQQLLQLVEEFDYFTFENKYSSFQVPFNEILYFETSEIPHKIRLISKNKTIEFYAELSEIEDKEERLFRCHRSFIINVMNVRSVDKGEKMALFEDEKACMISRRLLKETIQRIEKKPR